MFIAEVDYDIHGNKIEWKRCTACGNLTWTTETDDSAVLCNGSTCASVDLVGISNTHYKKQPISDGHRWEVWERDNFTCQMCGSRKNLSVDHIIPESKGGISHPDNYQTLCKKCNSRKGAR